MPRMIDAEAFVKWLLEHEKSANKNEQYDRGDEIDRPMHYSTKALVELIANQPTVDAEPVRLRIDVCDVDEEKGWYRRLLYCPCGQLIKTETWDAKRCFGTGTVLRDNKIPKHCPNCGAKIDKEAGE